jgi:hypothetical protein
MEELRSLLEIEGAGRVRVEWLVGE